jgi:phage terminase large subunit
MTAIPDILTTPIGFIEGVLGLPLYDWQADAVYKLEFAGWGKPIIQISALAPNEAGKSSRIVAGSGCYQIGVHPQGKCAITTKDQKQLNEQIIPAIEEQIHKFEGWKSVRSPYYKVTTPGKNGKPGGVLIAYVTDDSARVEGLHGSPDAPLLEIIDEAKSVPEPIFQGIDRCGYQALLMCSSGGLMQGTFYNSQTKNRAAFHCVNAGLKDCPHISPDKVKRIVEKWGENHPFTRSCVYGEFMEQDDTVQFIFPHSIVRNAVDNPPRHRPGQRIGFVDFAEGTAEHVLAERNGNKTTIALAFREADKHAACSRLIRGFLNADLKEDQIWGDAADKESLDILASMGWKVHRQSFGAPAHNDEYYQSWSAEAWGETSIGVSKGELIVPDDDILIAQLTSRQKTFVGRGKVGAEEKYDMRKRGVESPDRADAYCGANNVYDANQFITKQPFRIPPGFVTEHQGYGEGAEEFAEAMGAGVGL